MEQGPIRQKALRDLFPQVQADRVEKLLQVPDLQAMHALTLLSKRLRAMREHKIDVSALEGPLNTAYHPARNALKGHLTQAGWNSSEINAAESVASGTIKLK